VTAETPGLFVDSPQESDSLYPFLAVPAEPTTKRFISGDAVMHRSRLCALLIDCQTADVDEAARFWSQALGRAVDPDHPGTRGNYRMLETPPDEPIVQIQRVSHESRVHIDIETDDIPAEVARLERLGAKVVDRLERWVVMQAPTGQRFCVVRVQRPGFPKNANAWD
jgi:predicted enzyme related to lactoylglutathione lyase